MRDGLGGLGGRLGRFDWLVKVSRSHNAAFIVRCHARYPLAASAGAIRFTGRGSLFGVALGIEW